MLRRVLVFAALVPGAFFAAAMPAVAQAPFSVQRAVAYVVCGDRQGSGALTTADGYVITAGHVAMDPLSRQVAAECEVGFVDDQSLEPTTFFKASVVHVIFEAKTDRDFAVLKLGDRISGSGSLPAPLATDEFAAVGTAVTAYGYPGGSPQRLETGSGRITAFDRGTIESDAVITQGYSGGPVLDAADRLVGVSKQVSVSIDEKTGQQTSVSYELGDVLALENWLDGFPPATHDTFLTVGDPSRRDGAPYVIRDEGPGCAYVVRTTTSPAVYCLLDGPERLVFPNEKTFFSWYPDFSAVRYIAPADLASYALVGNVTMKQGSLVKIVTDPSVYLVVDAIGTVREVPSEARAAQLFGAAWAAKVRDVPEEYFGDYAIHAPLQ